MRAQQERRYDEYENMRLDALMTRQAYHAKKLKPDDLFKRPNGSERKGKSKQELREQMEQQQAFLDRLSFAKK